MASQMAKTDGVMLNAIGWKLDDDPQPVIYFGPTEKNVKSISGDRIKKMFRQVPSLWAGLAKGKKDTLYEKHINGVRLGFGWAGSPTELASHPAALVLIDERDRMKLVKGEGDPVTLAKARVSTYPNGLVLVVSTPLEGAVDTETLETGLTHWRVAPAEDIQSPTWRLWQSGTRHEWAWPCPHCGDYSIPRFALLRWEQGADPDRAWETARLVCPHCGAESTDRHKEAMNHHGRFVAPGQWITPDGTVQGEAPDNPIASFWVSGLCSNWVSLGERAHDYVKAAHSGDPGELQGVVNTGLGELYRLKGEAPKTEAVKACALGYRLGEVPEAVMLLTSGVDVQKNRLVWMVRGWAPGLTSYLIDRGELWGDTEQLEVWSRLATEILLERWGDLPIARMAVDSGYRAEIVYQFARAHPRQVLATKGHDQLDKPFKATLIDVNVRGKLIRHGVQLWHFDTGLAKSFIHGRIDWPQDQPGAWFLPSDIDDDYCRQIVAEQRLTTAAGRVLWIRTRKDNHFLDCEGLAYLARRILGSGRTPASGERPRVATPPPRPQSSGGWINTSGDWL